MFGYCDRCRYAQYSHFKIHSEADYYKLEIDGYDGNAGDSLNDPWYGSNNSPFSTYNRDNDRSSLNCASMLKVNDSRNNQCDGVNQCVCSRCFAGRLVVEVMRPRSERTVPARSAGSDRTTGHRLVPLARMGLHAEEGDPDDPAERTADDGDNEWDVNATKNGLLLNQF